MEKRGVVEERGVWEDTGQRVSIGKIEPLKVVRAVPAYTGFWAALGAGAIWIAMAQGSGELIWWPYLVAKYGGAFIGIVLLSCLAQYWVNLEVIRYTATTGETIFSGFARINKIYAAFMWVGLVIVSFWFGAYASAGATALAELTGFPVGLSARGQTLFWAYLTMAVFLAAIVFGKVVYKMVEGFMTAIVVITIGGLLFAVFQGEVLSQLPSFFAYYFNPFSVHRPPNWEPADISVLLTGIAFAGMGGFYNLMYSYWVRDKGLGLARYAGRVTSPITGKPETIPSSGFAFEDTPENERRYKQWVRYLHYDNSVAVGGNTFTLMLTMLLAFALLHPKGLVPSGWQIAVVQSAFFEVAWGPIGRAIFLLVAAAFLADSWLGLVDAISRMHSDFFSAMFDWAKKLSFRTWYYTFVGILTFLSVVTIPFAQPGTLLIIGGVLNFIAMAIYCPFLIYLNYYKVPRALPRWTRPKNGTLVMMIIVTLFYGVISIFYLLYRFRLI